MEKGGFRKDNKEAMLKRMKSSLTVEEAERLEETREHGQLVPGSWAYKIALRLDNVQQTVFKYKLDIEKTLWSIKNTSNAITRAKAQLDSGLITEKLKDDLVMNIDELRAHIEYMKWTQAVEVNQIPRVLGEIRMLTGHKNLIGEVIMTNEQFEQYVEDTIVKLKMLGFDLI